MSYYNAIIAKATGIADPLMLEVIEDLMRNVIFHSTLSWLTLEQLEQGAREAKQVIDLEISLGITADTTPEEIEQKLRQLR